MTIDGEVVERVPDFKFLGLQISDDLTWTVNTSNIIKRANQRLFFLRPPRRNGLPQKLLITFYRCTTESILIYCCSVWYRSCSDEEKKNLRRVVRTAERIVGSSLPDLADIYSTRLLTCATNIVQDPTHPGNCLLFVNLE